MERRVVVWVCACAWWLAGCAGAEREAALLAQTVEVGIERLHGQQTRVIGALAEVEREAVDEEWASIYERAEAGYRQREGLGESDALSSRQRMEIAALAAAAREELLASIEMKEAQLAAASRASVDAVRGMQRELVGYLAARSDAVETRSRMLRWLGVMEETQRGRGEETK